MYNQTTTTLSVNASVTDGGTLTYQWYSNTTKSNTGGTAVTTTQGSGGTTSSLALNKSAHSDWTKQYYYYVVVTNKLASSAATAAVTSVPITVTFLNGKWKSSYGDYFDINITSYNSSTKSATGTINGGDYNILEIHGDMTTQNLTFYCYEVNGWNAGTYCAFSINVTKNTTKTIYSQAWGSTTLAAAKSSWPHSDSGWNTDDPYTITTQ